MKELRVLQVLNRLNIGGVSLMVFNLCKTQEENTNVKLLSGLAEEGEGDASVLADEMGISVTHVPEMKRKLNFKNDKEAYRVIRNYIRVFQPHIVHTHAAKPGALGRLAAYNEKVPVIVHTFHGHVFDGYFGSIKTNMYLQIERFLAKRTTKIIAISASQKKELSEKYRIAEASKFEVIHNGFDLEPFQQNIEDKRITFRKKWKIGENEVIIGIIGRLAPIKNIAYFIEIINELKHSCALPFKALIIGDGEEREILEQQANVLSLNDKIIFTSWINPIDTAYAGIDMLALCSKNEGTPTTIIEAQAAGIPVVSNDVGGVKDIVIPNESAFLIEKDDLSSFVQQLKLLLENRSLRKKMGEKGRAYVNENFSKEQMLEQTYSLYRNLLENDFLS